MSMKSITFKAPDSMVAAIDQIVSDHQIDRGLLIRDALAHYLGADDTLEADLAEADRQIAAGETIPHEEVLAWFEAERPKAKAA